MFASLLSEGLVLPRAGLPLAQTKADSHITVEAAVTPDYRENLRVDLLVAEGDNVAEGQPLMHLRSAPDVALVAPMAARVARIELNPGHRLSQVVLFHDPYGDRHQFEAFKTATESAQLRALLQATGLWRAFRSRPSGQMPAQVETPAAIFVMGVDSRPDAPSPWAAIEGRADEFSRGLEALSLFSEARCFLCEPKGQAFEGDVPPSITRIGAGTNHPQGSAGFLIHRNFPARTDRPVWSIHAEDLVDIGALLKSGYLPPTRLVAITGDALREPRLVRCQKGADLRGLIQNLVKPGQHDVISGSVLDGRPAHWLAPHDRQVTVLERPPRRETRHWFRAALEQAARHAPIIPTAALEQAFGGAIPAAALVRALASGDAETFTRLGGLSLIEEDIALADYVTGARPRLAKQLRAMLAQIEAEESAL